jgi:hypothetical protein
VWADKDGAISKDDVLKRFESIDTDKDGKLSKSELDAHTRETLKKMQEARSGGHRHDGTKHKKPADESKKDESKKDEAPKDAPKAETKASTDVVPATAEVPVAAVEFSDAPAIAELSL